MNPAASSSVVRPLDAQPSPPCVLQPEGALTAYTVADWRHRFLEQLEAPGPVIVDLGRTTECDTLGLQLLCATQRTAQQAARAFTIIRIPAAVADLARATGLEIELIHEGNAS